MTQFLRLLADPLLLLALLMGIAAILWWKKKRKGTVVTLSVAAFFLFVITMSPLPVWLATSLEQRFSSAYPLPAIRQDDSATLILVLGGGHATGHDISYANMLSGEALGRLAEGVRLYHLIDDAKLVFSGYAEDGGRLPQAEILARAALELGVSQNDTMTMSSPRHTAEEAKSWVARFGKNKYPILVTSALHMPRAAGWFEKYGVTIIPAPTNHQFIYKDNVKKWHLWPSYPRFGMTQRLLQEYIGLCILRITPSGD